MQQIIQEYFPSQYQILDDRSRKIKIQECEACFYDRDVHKQGVEDIGSSVGCI